MGGINTHLQLAMLNEVDRYSLALAAIKHIPGCAENAADVQSWLKEQRVDHLAFARREGEDPQGIREWTWDRSGPH
jgi:xylulose-5-phosphate/fructose-6-phosphate phosphoketolase